MLKHHRFNDIVWQHLRSVRVDLLLAMLCILGTTLTSLVAPWPLKLIFDHLLLHKPVPQSLDFASTYIGDRLS
jgi:hypothetical protein